MGEKPLVLGTCECGIYGICYDEETMVETGRCHMTLQELTEKFDRADREIDSWEKIAT